MGKESSKIAFQYAQALFKSVEKDELEVVGEALFELSELHKESEDFRMSLLNPGIPSSQRIEVVQELLKIQQSKFANISEGAFQKYSNFLLLMVDNARLKYICEVSAEFEALLIKLKENLSLKIESAFELPTDERRDIQTKIEKDFSKLATISWSVNPELLGGLVVKLGDRVLDNSIKGSLEKLRSELMA